MMKNLRVALPLFWGRWGTPIPYPGTLSRGHRNRMRAPKVTDPEKMHPPSTNSTPEFVERLEALFERHKAVWCGRRARGILSRGGKVKFRVYELSERRRDGRDGGEFLKTSSRHPHRVSTTVVSERVTVGGRVPGSPLPRDDQFHASRSPARGSPIGATMPLRVQASGSKPANRRGDVQHQRGCWLVSAPKKCRRSRARIAARKPPRRRHADLAAWRRADARGTSGLRVRRAVLSRSRESLGEDRPRASRRTSAPLVWFRASDRSRGRDGFFPGSPTQGLAGGGDVQADARDVGVP